VIREAQKREKGERNEEGLRVRPCGGLSAKYPGLCKKAPTLDFSLLDVRI
jgi:hypothetical protein